MQKLIGSMLVLFVLFASVSYADQYEFSVGLAEGIKSLTNKILGDRDIPQSIKDQVSRIQPSGEIEYEAIADKITTIAANAQTRLSQLQPGAAQPQPAAAAAAPALGEVQNALALLNVAIQTIGWYDQTAKGTPSVEDTIVAVKIAETIRELALPYNLKSSSELPVEFVRQHNLQQQNIFTVGDLDRKLRDNLESLIKKAEEKHKEDLKLEERAGLDLGTYGTPILYKGFNLFGWFIWLVFLLVLLWSLGKTSGKSRKVLWIFIALFLFATAFFRASGFGKFFVYTTLALFVILSLIILKGGPLAYRLRAWFELRKRRLKFRPLLAIKEFFSGKKLQLYALFKIKEDLLKENHERLVGKEKGKEGILARITGPADLWRPDIERFEKEWREQVIVSLEDTNQKMIEGVKKYKTFLSKFSGAFGRRFDAALDRDRELLKQFKEKVFERHNQELGQTFKFTDQGRVIFKQGHELMKQNLHALDLLLDEEERLVKSGPEDINKLATALKQWQFILEYEEALIEKESEILHALSTGHIKHGEDLPHTFEILKEVVTKLNDVLKEEREKVAVMQELERKIAPNLEKVTKDEMEMMQKVKQTNKAQETLDERNFTVQSVNPLDLSGGKVIGLDELERDILHVDRITDAMLNEMLTSEKGIPAGGGAVEAREPGITKLSAWILREYASDKAQELVTDIERMVKHYGANLGANLRNVRWHIKDAIHDVYPPFEEEEE